MVKFGLVVFGHMRKDTHTDRHTDIQRHTDTLLAILHTSPGGEVITELKKKAGMEENSLLPTALASEIMQSPPSVCPSVCFHPSGPTDH